MLNIWPNKQPGQYLVNSSTIDMDDFYQGTILILMIHIYFDKNMILYFLNFSCSQCHASPLIFDLTHPKGAVRRQG